MSNKGFTVIELLIVIAIIAIVGIIFSSLSSFLDEDKIEEELEIQPVPLKIY